MNLIGLTGSAGCGKDTLADMKAKSNWKRFAFADALKEICMQFLGLSYEDAYTQSGKMKFNDFWEMTNREILQKIGTDAFRNGFHKDTWVKIAELKLTKMLDAGEKVIITDVRFDNEAELVEKLGGIVVKINRKSANNLLTNEEKKHPSEMGINDDYVTFEIDNDYSINDMVKMFDFKLNHFSNTYNSIWKNLIYVENITRVNAKKISFNFAKYCDFDLDIFSIYTTDKVIRFESAMLKKSFVYDFTEDQLIFADKNMDSTKKENWNSIKKFLSEK